MATTKPIPDHVTAALRAWHAVAVEYNPNYPSESVGLRARAFWKAFENECLKWESDGRALRNIGGFGHTGTGSG